MSVDEHVKGTAVKGEPGRIIAGAEVNAQWQQPLPAQRHVGRIPLRGRRILRRMPQGKQVFPAACVVIHQLLLRLYIAAYNGVIVPGQIPLLVVAALNVGKVPTVYVRHGFLSLPARFPCLIVHVCVLLSKFLWVF